MSIFPSHSEILVSPFSREEVARKIHAVTREVDYLSHPTTKEKHHFNGVVNDATFTLSLIITRPNSFIPLIKGKIESTNSGCILFLKYTLFPSSMFFLAFWGLICFLFALYLALHDGKWLYALFSLSAGVGNFIFAWSYFKTKLKESQRVFHDMLSLQEKS